MLTEFNRISHSIDSINSFYQIAPTFKWIRIFKQNYISSEGVYQKTQLLINQLTQIEL
tara:strand:+ start:416 stop:589 length:174 start_codon:yes stop_codon:yes gene_type:complete